MKKKIKKVTPIKSETLCEKCVNGYTDGGCVGRKCEDCVAEMETSNGKSRCYCTSISNGQKCERYNRKLPSLQIGDFKITNTEIVYSPKDDKSEVVNMPYRITGRMQDGTAFVRSETGEEGVGHFTTQRRLPEIINKLAELEDKIESGDLIEVVRCKDCEHSNSCKTMLVKSMTMDAQGKVTFHRDIEHYCSKGKRKEV